MEMYYLRKSAVHRVKRLLGRRTVPNRYGPLLAEIDSIHPRTILEIGTNDGLNAARLVARARRYRDDVQYFGFDLFESMTDDTFLSEFSLAPPALEAVEDYLVRHGVANHRLFPGNTHDSLPRSIADLPPMDLVFIDGGHSEETVAADWNNVQPLLHPGSVVFFDDYPNWGVGPVVDSIDRARWEVSVPEVMDVYRVNPKLRSGVGSDRLACRVARVRARAGAGAVAAGGPIPIME